MTQPKDTTPKLGKDDIVCVLDHRDVNGSIDFRLEINKDETTSIEWISRSGIQHQTFTSGKFKKYYKDTNNTDSFKSFLFELQTNNNCKPEYWIELPAELFVKTEEQTHKGKAVIHGNLTNTEIRNIPYKRVIEACKETYTFPEKELDNVCIMYSVDENNYRNLQRNDQLMYDDIQWEKTETQGKKKRLLPYKKGKVMLQLMTTNYCKQSGMPLSSIITHSKDSATKKDESLTDLEIPKMSLREAFSFINDKPTQTQKETSQENKEQTAAPKKKKPPPKPKKSTFDIAMQKYKQEFKEELEAMNETQTDTQTEAQTQPQIQIQNQNQKNDLLVSTIGLLNTLISNSNNNSTLAKLNEKLNLNQTETKSKAKTEVITNESETKKDEIKPPFKKGTIGRTICVFDEMMDQDSTVKLLTRCKKKKIVTNEQQLDKEKRKLKFCQLKDIQIDRKDTDVYTRTWSKDNLPTNSETGKPWTFAQALQSDLIGSIDSTKWKVRKTLVIDTRSKQENENKSKMEKKTDE